MKLKSTSFWIKVASIIALLNPLTASAAASPLVEMADSLYRYQSYDAAITEYKRFLFFHPEVDANSDIQFKLARSYYQTGDMDQAINICRAAADLCSDPERKNSITFRLCQWYIEFYHYRFAEIELNKIISSQSEREARNKAFLMLFLLNLERGDLDQAKKTLLNFIPANEREVKIQTELLTALNENPSSRSPKAAKWISTFVPGGGQIYAGAYLEGLNSFALNFLIGYWITNLVIEEKYTSALVLTQYVFWRYYSGSRYHAARFAKKYNREQARLYKLGILNRARPLFQGR